jgi:hypothetical protein
LRVVISGFTDPIAKQSIFHQAPQPSLAQRRKLSTKPQ